eukprot:6930545-Prymnesium_polylepis.1
MQHTPLPHTGRAPLPLCILLPRCRGARERVCVRSEIKDEVVPDRPGGGDACPERARDAPAPRRARSV